VDPVVLGGLLAINSTIPGDSCSTSGSAKQYRLNGLTGLSFPTTAINNTVGYLGSPLIVAAGEAVWSTRKGSGRYTVTRKLNTLSTGTSGSEGTVESTVTSVGGRISWREINQ
jgi:Tfp pilus tip-associated adhesin PilY1